MVSQNGQTVCFRWIAFQEGSWVRAQMSLGLFVLTPECFGWEVKGPSSQAEDCGEFRHNFGPRARTTWLSSRDQWPASCVGRSVGLSEPPCLLLWSQGVGSSVWSPPTLCFCELEPTSETGSHRGSSELQSCAAGEAETGRRVAGAGSSQGQSGLQVPQRRPSPRCA